jgi:hypothetical protein
MQKASVYTVVVSTAFPVDHDDLSRKQDQLDCARAADAGNRGQISRALRWLR